VIGAAARRKAAQFMTARRAMSARRACVLLGISRRWLRYEWQAASSGSSGDAGGLLKELKDLAARHPRYGYRRLHVMLIRQGWQVNVKRIRRLCVVHGLKLKRKKPRKRRGIGTGTPLLRAEHADHVWAYDFMHDSCRDGRTLKILTVEDEFTRECLTIEVERRMPASFVMRTLLRLFTQRGRRPQYVRSDNGPEFIAKALMKMLAEQRVEVTHIEPGSPWQNGRNERFNGSLRDECLNLETFEHRDQARAVCRLYARHYNQERPHSALGYRTPAEFAAAEAEEQTRSIMRPAAKQRTSKAIV
jgi:putative transposase